MSFNDYTKMKMSENQMTPNTIKQHRPTSSKMRQGHSNGHCKAITRNATITNKMKPTQTQPTSFNEYETNELNKQTVINQKYDKTEPEP